MKNKQYVGNSDAETFELVDVYEGVAAEFARQDKAEWRKAEWRWVCRDCKRQYPESTEGLKKTVNPSGYQLLLCTCEGVVDLTPLEATRVR